MARFFSNRKYSAMSTPISTLISFAILAMLVACCQRGDSDTVELARTSPAMQESLPEVPSSLTHFKAAEQQLANGRYIYAATQLDKGIVAFRIETGKLSGVHAARANHAIDVLTRLRKTLRHGAAISTDDLHLAILTAMESEPEPVHSLPKPNRGIFVPVGGR